MKAPARDARRAKKNLDMPIRFRGRGEGARIFLGGSVSGLHQNFEGAAEVLGMSEGVELAGLRGRRQKARGELRKEFSLSLQRLGNQSSGFARAANTAEIHGSCNVLLAGIRERIIDEPMIAIGAQGAVRARGNSFFTVVDGEK